MSKKNMSRREFVKGTVTGVALLGSGAAAPSAAQTRTSPLRLGGPTFEKYDGPDEWVGVLGKLGYRAAGAQTEELTQPLQVPPLRGPPADHLGIALSAETGLLRMDQVFTSG